MTILALARHYWVMIHEETGGRGDGETLKTGIGLRLQQNPIPSV
ncbi:hypothetical protein [Trichormus sp. NMC-1]|nr:hypothetical protein [Trichormus sp. NMC-1]